MANQVIGMDAICPECGHSLTRDTKPMTLNLNGLSVTFDMPGWYCAECGESLHDGADMQESDRQLHLLRARSSAPSPKELSREVKTIRTAIPAGTKQPA